MLLEVKNLTKLYPGNYGIKGLNLTLEAGEVVALLGPNGAGKTTAMKAMMDFVSHNNGEVMYKGKSITDYPELTKKEIGMIIGEPSPYLHLTATQYLRLYQRFYSEESTEDINKVLKAVKLEKRRSDKIKTFSTGMKQRLSLAKALLIKPKLMVLDEPFSGMDIEGRNEIVRLLKNKVETENVGMIISSHLIHDIEGITTKVCIIREGKWIETEEVSIIKQKYPTIEAYYLSKNVEQRKEPV